MFASCVLVSIRAGKTLALLNQRIIFEKRIL